MPSGRRLTQADIAREAGVSQATVSLVLNNRTSGDVRISAATRARVRETIERLGYRANPAAQSLAGGQNRILGLFTFEPVFPTDTRDFYNPFLTGVESEAANLGYDLLLFTSCSTPATPRLYADGVNRLRISDGAILLGRRHDPDELARLHEESFPFVFIGRREITGGRLSYVTADYTTASHDLVRQLLDLGHRRVAFVASEEAGTEADEDRLAGYRQALLEVNAGEELVRFVADDAVLDPLLDELLAADVTAIAAEQQALAERLAERASRRGCEVPAALSIVVLGDTTGARGTDTDWTGFRIPRHDMGVAATRLLVQQLSGDEGGEVQVVLPCEPIAGATIGRRG